MTDQTAFYITEDVIGHKGDVYALKGDKVTILDRTSGTECDVVLIKNGRNKAWIQEKYLSEEFILPNNSNAKKVKR